MQIDIPQDIGVIAQEKAAAMGVSVADFVSHLILVEESEAMTEAELAASLASIDRGMEDVRAGRTISAKEALDRIAKEFGLKQPT